LLVPDLEILDPTPARVPPTSDNLYPIVQCRAPPLSELLAPSASSPDTPSESGSATQIRINLRDSPQAFSKAIAQAFQSVLIPPQIEDLDVILAQPLLRTQSRTQSQVVVLPPFANVSLFDRAANDFERSKLENPRCFSPGDRLSVRGGVQEKGSHGCFLSTSADLTPGAGELVLVESKERHPVIQPLVGMSCQLDVLVDNPNIEAHSFDPRIPLTHISSTSLKLFSACIPKNKPVLAIQSAVSVAAAFPHPSSGTDFLLTIGRRPKIFKLPKTTYLTTAPEPKVAIPRPDNPAPDFSCFTHWGQYPENELCKRRSVTQAVRALRRREISKRIPPAVPYKRIKSRELLGLTQAYVRLLRRTPWHCSEMTAKARSGLAKGLIHTMDREYDERKSKRELHRDFSEWFENELLVIEGSQDTTGDLEDFEFGQLEEEESIESVFDLLDDGKEIPKVALFNTKIDWDALGLGDLPKRTIEKRIEWAVVDGQVKMTVQWIRDQRIVKRDAWHNRPRKTATPRSARSLERLDAVGQKTRPDPSKTEVVQ
jgi:hypothetical protein